MGQQPSLICTVTRMQIMEVGTKQAWGAVRGLLTSQKAGGESQCRESTGESGRGGQVSGNRLFCLGKVTC